MGNCEHEAPGSGMTCTDCRPGWREVSKAEYDASLAWQQAQATRASQADIQRLEAKLDALILALKAGAIGRWQ